MREALLELIRRDGGVTATDASCELGGSTGLYSFHLRQLARYGLIEEAPGARGRVRPWRLARSRVAKPPEQPESPEQPGSWSASGAGLGTGTAGLGTGTAGLGTGTAGLGTGTAGPGTGTAGPGAEPPGLSAVMQELGAVARGLEDESYRRWLEHRDAAPRRWRRDEAFSQVVYLTPDEMAGMAEVIRALIGQYRYREDRAGVRPRGAAPVAVVARLFPLLEPGAGEAPGSG